MNVRANILECITKTRNRAAEGVLENALAQTAGIEQQQIVDVLIKRNLRSGWIALIRNFDRLSDEDRGRLLANPRDLFGPLAEAMGDAEGQGRQNAIRIVRQAADTKLVSLLTDALTDNRPQVRELAGDALLEAIRRFRAEGSNNLAVDLPELQRAMAVAIRGFKTHRQTSALVAAFIFERQIDSPMWLIFNDSYADATRSGNIIFRQLTDPALAAGAFLALSSALKVAALTGLASCDHPAMVDGLVRESYRLLDPQLRTNIEGVSHFKFLAEARAGTRWEKEQPLGWLRLIECLNLNEQLRIQLIKRLLDNLGESAGVVVSMLALRALSQISAVEVMPILAGLTNAVHECVARSATRYVLTRKHSDWRAFAPQMMQSRHDCVRKLISGVAGAGKYNDLWQEYHKLPPAVQHNTTRIASTDDAQFGEQLKAKLSGTVADIAQGLRMLMSLKSMNPYRQQIVALCGHADTRVVSAAIKLIGKLEDPQYTGLLEAAAQHSDARVRANAVEAMGILRVAHTSKHVMGMLTSRHNRERANAIKAISKFDFSTTQDCLIKMLGDANPLHRISALWVVSQLEMLDIVRHVGMMSRKDPNAKVRSRAAELLQNLQVVATTAATT
jgi:HEAT repeat protein